MSSSINIESIKERLKKLNRSIFYDTIQMKFVNMTDHIVEMALYLIKTMIAMKYDPANTRRRIILYADQMFGSGKSRLGTEFIGQVKIHFEKIKEKLKEIASNEQEHEYAINVLNCLAESRMYRFEFEMLVFGDKIDVNKRLAELLHVDLKTLETKFDSDQKNSYFLHVDELSCFELDQVYSVWRQLHALRLKLFMNGIFLHLYFSGKQTLFNLIGTGTKSSPTSVKWVILHPLQERYVKEIVQDIVSQNKLYVTDIDYFSKQLHYYTCGVPRLIEFVLLILTKTNAKLETENEIDEVLDQVCFNCIQKHAPDSQKFAIESSMLENAAVQLVLAAQMGVELKFKDELEVIDPITGKKKKDTVQNWLARLPLYLNGSMQSEKVEVLTKGYVYRLLKPALENYSAFRYLEKFDTPNASMMKREEVYEMLITHQFFTTAYYVKKWPSFLEETKVKQEEMEIKNTFILPQFTEVAKQLNMKVFDMNTINQIKAMHPSHLKTVLQKLPQNTLVQVRDQSKSADLYIITGNHVIIGIQMKSGNQEKIGYKNLWEEYEKASLPSNSIFVMMALKYSKNLNSLIDKQTQYLHLTEGIYYTYSNVLMQSIKYQNRKKAELQYIYYAGIRWNVSKNINQSSDSFIFEKVKYKVEANGPEKENLLKILKGNHNFKQVLNIGKYNEIVIVSPELIKRFLGEENWKHLEKIQSLTNNKKEVLQILSIKRLVEESGTLKRKYEDTNIEGDYGMLTQWFQILILL